jgi:hypothetical protein
MYIYQSARGSDMVTSYDQDRPYHGEHGPKDFITPQNRFAARERQKRECMSILTVPISFQQSTIVLASSGSRNSGDFDYVPGHTTVISSSVAAKWPDQSACSRRGACFVLSFIT